MNQKFLKWKTFPTYGSILFITKVREKVRFIFPLLVLFPSFHVTFLHAICRLEAKMGLLVIMKVSFALKFFFDEGSFC